MSFEELIERAPYFSKEFIKKVKQKFNDNHSIGYTSRPDMRIRSHVDTPRGAVIAVTIR